MALVNNGVWSIVYSFRDNNGKVGGCSVNVDQTIIFADVLTLAGTLAARLAAVSDATLIGYQISTAYVEDAPAAPPATSEVERKLRIGLTAGRFLNTSYLEVPSPKFTLEINGTDVVDLANADIVALRGALINTGGVLGSTGLKTYFGEDITATSEPVVTHRNRKAER